MLTLFTVWYWLPGCYQPLCPSPKRSQQLLPSAVTDADARSWSCQGYTSGLEWESLTSSSARDEEWQTDPQGAGRRRGERKEMKISVLTSRQSSVMMLMFRFSQEFPGKGNYSDTWLFYTLVHATACGSSHSPGKSYGSHICSYRNSNELCSAPSEAPTDRAKLKQPLCKQLLQSIQLTAEMSQKVLQISVVPLPKTCFARRWRALALVLREPWYPSCGEQRVPSPALPHYRSIRGSSGLL